MPLPNFRPPRLSRLVRQANPLREVIDDARELVRSAGDSIREVASSLHIEAPEEPIPREPEAPSIKAVREGTACLPCSRDHFLTTSSSLSEGIRFARENGIKDHEVMRRIRIALQELDIMERIDLAPEEIAKLKGAERELADWTLKQSRELRHEITDIKDVKSMEQAAARASHTTEEFMTRLWAIPEEECDTCGEIRESIRHFIEKRKRERAGI